MKAESGSEGEVTGCIAAVNLSQHGVTGYKATVNLSQYEVTGYIAAVNLSQRWSNWLQRCC